MLDTESLMKILAFLDEIGICVREQSVDDASFLPGIDVRDGTLIYDPKVLVHAGDLLHEAGHLAVMTPEVRSGAAAEVEATPADEMAAIAWSWAALVHIGIPPEVVFHSDGYKGGSAQIVSQFSSGHGFGVPMLAMWQMTGDPNGKVPFDGPAFPNMWHWLRKGDDGS